LKDTGRSMKVLTFPSIPNTLGIITSISIPIWWILIIGASLQFVAALLNIITCSYLYKRFHTIRLSYENRWRLSTYRSFYIICTLLIMILVFSFLQFSGGASGYYRLLLLLCFVGVITSSIVDIVYANNLSKLIGSTTDG
jgi:hypothetical protein